jgi:hypothetical protein
MRSGSGQDAIDELLGRLPGGIVFRDEQAAVKWTAQTIRALYEYKLSAAQQSADDREQSDPIEAGYVHAKDMGTRPRRQRLPWIDKLLDTVAEACFCQIVPLSGTLSAWLIGRRTDRRVALHLVGSIVPTIERLAQDAYLREYHSQRKAGSVEAARGYKDTYFDGFVTQLVGAVTQQLQVLQGDAAAEQVLAVARQDVAAYMNENFLPTRGSKNERRASAS